MCYEPIAPEARKNFGFYVSNSHKIATTENFSPIRGGGRCPPTKIRGGRSPPAPAAPTSMVYTLLAVNTARYWLTVLNAPLLLLHDCTL